MIYRKHACQKASRPAAAVALALVATLSSTAVSAPPESPKPRLPGIKVGVFPVEIRSVWTTADGLPSDDVASIAALATGEVYAGTANGLARFAGNKWSAVPSLIAPVKLLTPYRGGVLVTSGESLRWIRGEISERFAELPQAARNTDGLRSLAAGNTVLLGTRDGLFEFDGKTFVRVTPLDGLLGAAKEIRQAAVAGDGRVAVAASGGLFVRDVKGSWERQIPVDGSRSWWPRDVRGVAFDARGRLWFASPAGVGRLDQGAWLLFTGSEGLPYDDFTTLAGGENGAVWLGTKIGAIRFDGSSWNYRQGRRWLPDDHVRSIAVTEQGDAWFATAHGVGRIERRGMTLGDKARLFEDAIDKFHRRTPYGYVLGVSLQHPGDTSRRTQHDSDNDGLWTGMYGAGECFAYAATKDPAAKRRATAAFEALRFLCEVTQGGERPAPKGFPARSIRSTSDPDPNTADQLENDLLQQVRDPKWKSIAPRWPKSADGKWYWKCDTSSDELDGHFFLYACYFDLVAGTDAEKLRVREVVSAVADHLLDHDFDLVDHDGKPTRWARFGPVTVNDPAWSVERGLNSLSILSYLAVAEHVTGLRKYREAFDRLVKQHAYLANLPNLKIQFGPGTGNQSDDEMAMMCYYNLLKYATDPEVRRVTTTSLRRFWALEEPERNPLFNALFAASYEGLGRFERSAPKSCLEDAADSLKRFPLDRFDWRSDNSRRIDVMPLSRAANAFSRRPRGHMRSGKVVPIDERFFSHWNHDPWTLESGGEGKTLADGAVFLLPYYLALYHGFIIDDSVQSRTASSEKPDPNRRRDE